MFAVAVVAIMIVGNRSALQGRQLTWCTFVFAGVLSIVRIVIFDLDRTLEGAVRANADTILATIHDMEKALTARAE